jgi:hypothetical protein
MAGVSKSPLPAAHRLGRCIYTIATLGTEKKIVVFRKSHAHCKSGGVEKIGTTTSAKIRAVRTFYDSCTIS